MALTKTGVLNLLASTPVVPGTPLYSASMAIGYGCSIIAVVTNGATGPTVGLTATLQVSADNTNFVGTDDVRVAPTTAGAVTFNCFNLGVGGNDNGDWSYARVQFAGNTGQNVNALVVASGTTGI